MRQCGSQQLQSGMVLARPIYDQHYRKLLAEGTTLNSMSIKRVQDMGFKYVYIQEDGTENIHVEELIGVQCRREASEALERLATVDKQRNKGTSNPFQVRQKEKAFGTEQQALVQRAINSMMRDLMYARQPVYFPGVYLAKDQLINHSTDVAILTMLIGLGFGFTNKDLAILGKAALFHDVGKIRLDEELTYLHPMDMEEEQEDLYRMHPQMGAVLLEQDITNDIHVTMAVLQHHERQDGTGFPEGLKGSGEPPTSKVRERGTIHRFAEIISVANYFDNLVSGRVEREPLNPMDAVQHILNHTPDWFNPHVTQMALSVINVFPEGCNVEIRESRHYSLVGFRGVVSKINIENLSRPTITLLYNARHQRLEKPLIVDFRDDSRIKLDYLTDL
ncbi:HD domain-containing protein [bacterium]|nr:HD domain-containing protein [bacterium]